MDKNVTILVATVILAVAILGAAFMFTQKSASPSGGTPSSTPLTNPLQAAEIACLEGGGTWAPDQTGGLGLICNH